MYRLSYNRNTAGLTQKYAIIQGEKQKYPVGISTIFIIDLPTPTIVSDMECSTTINHWKFSKYVIDNMYLFLFYFDSLSINFFCQRS